ncbi:MAG: HdeD family acid-resistance protein [Sphingomonadaceae bacterium]
MENQVPAVEPWWVLAIAGVVSILFGIAAVAWPGMTLFVLVWLWGAYAIIYGIVSLVAMFRAIGSGATWWTHLLIGAISIGAGLYVVANPAISSVILLYVIAIWAITLGVVEIVAGISSAQLLPVIAGVITVLFGFVLFGNPAAGAVALVWLIGIFAIVRGIVLLVGAFRVPPVTGPTAG